MCKQYWLFFPAVWGKKNTYTNTYIHIFTHIHIYIPIYIKTYNTDRLESCLWARKCAHIFGDQNRELLLSYLFYILLHKSFDHRNIIRFIHQAHIQWLVHIHTYKHTQTHYSRSEGRRRPWFPNSWYLHELYFKT
jgi:hypothetical protein